LSLLYATGAEHPLRPACRRILQAASARQVQAHVSAEAIQEFVHHRLRRTDRESAVQQARAVADACVIHPFDRAVLDRAIEMIATSTLRGRDAVHAASAQLAGFEAIVSPYSDFDAAPGLRRIDPHDAL
jgi:uncharacterized protein